VKILLIHNYYQHAGGEDSVVAKEHELLIAHGHDVQILNVNNDKITSVWDKLVVA